MTVALILATGVVGIACLAGALACLSAQRGISRRAESRRPALSSERDSEETTDEL